MDYQGCSSLIVPASNGPLPPSCIMQERNFAQEYVLWLKNDSVCKGHKEAYDRVGRRLDEKEIFDTRTFQIKSLETSEHFK